MDASIFEQVTSNLTVRSICSRLGPAIPEGSTFDDLDEPTDEDVEETCYNPSLVVRTDGSDKGIFWCSDYFDRVDEFPPTVDDGMQPLQPSELLSSATTILDAVEIFGSKPNRFFYVLDANDIVVLFSTATYSSRSAVLLFSRSLWKSKIKH